MDLGSLQIEGWSVDERVLVGDYIPDCLDISNFFQRVGFEMFEVIWRHEMFEALLGELSFQ